MAENGKLPHYTPQHPLPNEIQAMERDETVCQYCGVSYLIHNEIKALEEKVKQMEQDVEEHRLCGEARQKQHERINELSRQKAELEGIIAAKRLLVEELQRQLKTTTSESKQLQKEAELLREQLKNAEMETNSVRKQLLPVGRLSRKLAETASGMQKELKELRSFAQSSLKQSGQSMVELQGSVTSLLKLADKERESLESQLRCQEMEKTMAAQSVKTLTQKLEARQQQEEEARQQEEEARQQQEQARRQQEEATVELARSHQELQDKCQKMEEQVKDMTKQIAHLSTWNNQKELELHQCQQNLKAKASEMSQVERDHEASTRRIQDMLVSKERELAAVRASLAEVKAGLEAQQQRNQEMMQKSAVSFSEVQQLQESLARARGDCEALKEEREAMITAHQNRIEELRESFKNKVEQADKWHAKMKDALAKENAKHLEELKSLEEGLKQNFLMELQIEKDRYNELVKKYQAEQKENEQKLRSEQAVSAGQAQAELERRLRELRKESEETEAALRREVASLKSIIADLENRLGAVNLESSDSLHSLQARLRQTEEELEQTSSQARQLQSTLENNKHEIVFLQDTVRKECEERFELTEALAAARHELLQLKRPAGGFPTLNGSGKAASSVDSSLHLARSSSSSLGSKQALQPLESPRGPAAPPAPQQQNPSPAKPPSVTVRRTPPPSSSISLGFQGDKQQQQPGRLKGANLEANRRRIAALLGKRS